MALMYYPRVGEIVICNFDAMAIGAEMIKSRPVVIVGPRLRRRANLVAVVPLSATVPDPIETYHCEITLNESLPPPFDKLVTWAKCDMIATVSIERLDRFKLPRERHGGARKWKTGFLDADQVRAVRAAVGMALGLIST